MPGSGTYRRLAHRDAAPEPTRPSPLRAGPRAVSRRPAALPEPRTVVRRPR